MQDNYRRSRMEIRLLESRMMRKYHVRFGGGMMEKGPTGHLASFPPNFLSLTENYKEKELEKGLTDHIQKFLIELGKGFAFVGKQYELKVEDTTYYLDLLFYHLELNCFCIIELKGTEFNPEHAGKINFYLSAVDDLVKRPQDNPSIGILLCKKKNKTAVEYALHDINKPIGVASFETEIVKSLPENLKSSLPTIEDIEAELNKNKEEA